ncbi:MAG: tetratricopeptide repeat protein [Oscillospiraceae bacterium]|nr:tetratricopeptide repeat protein [Oscillospiraceae bacterium]
MAAEVILMIEECKDRVLNSKRLAQVLKDSSLNGERFCFVLGAGASKESGIDTGIEMARKWGRYIEDNQDVFGKENVGDLKGKLKLDDLSKAKSEHYFDIYDFRWKGEPQNGYHFIQKCLKDVMPSYGYYPLAMLLSQGKHNLVITTNFDNLAEDALMACTAGRPLVIGHESLISYLDFSLSAPIIAKLHRDHFLRPFSSAKDTGALQDGWDNALNKAFGIYTPVVIGYAGGDHSLMDYLKMPATALRGLYWCYLKGYEPSTEIQELVCKKNGFFIEIDGFDSIMCLIGNKFDYTSPDKDIKERMTERAQTLTTSYVDRRKQLMTEDEAVENILKKEADSDKAALDERIKENPNDAYAYFSRGYFYSSEGEHNLAIEDYSKAIELKPDYAYAYNNRGAAYNSLGKYDLAIEDFNKAIELKPDNAYAYNNRGVAYNSLGKYDLAIEDFNKVIELRSGDAKAYYNRGNAYRKSDKYDIAIADYSKAIELDTDYADAYNNRGVAYNSLGKYDLAIEDFNKVIELRSDDAKAYNNRGLAYRKSDKYDTAIADYTKAIELGYKEEKVYRGRAEAYSAIGEHDKAAEDLKKADELRLL